MIPSGDGPSPTLQTPDSARAAAGPGPRPAQAPPGQRSSREPPRLVAPEPGHSLTLQRDGYKIDSVLPLLQKTKKKTKKGGVKVTSQLGKPGSGNEHPARTPNILILGIPCSGPREGGLRTRPTDTFLPCLCRARKREPQSSVALL